MTPLQLRRLHVLRSNARDVREWDYKPIQFGPPARVGWKSRIAQALVISAFCGLLLIGTALLGGIVWGTWQLFSAFVRWIGGVTL